MSKIRDLDGDGLPEIAIGCVDSVRVVDGQNGRLIWRIEADVIRTVRTISKGDADYIVVKSYAHNYLSLLSAVDGKPLWNRTDLRLGLNTVVTPDLYGDGWGDIVVDSQSVDGSEVEVVCISGATGSTIWTKSMNSVGSMTLVESSLGDVAIAIASSDGPVPHVGYLSLLNARTQEVIWSADLPAYQFIPIITYSESSNLLFVATILETGSRLAAYDPKDGGVVWEIPFHIVYPWQPEQFGLLPLPDLDGDGRGDLLANVWEDGGPVVALSSSRGSTIWSSKLDAPFRPQPATLVSDVDGDGVSDIAVGTGQGTGGWDGQGMVYLLSGADGKALWNFSASSDVQSDINEILSPGDLNGDGSPDIVATSWDHCVYALSSIALPHTLDAEPPVIYDVTIYPGPQIIIVSASIADTLSAIRMASIFYTSDGGVTWGNITMTASTPTSTTYEGEIQSPAPYVKLQFHIEAVDAWGNVARSPTQEYTVTIPLWIYVVIGAVMALLFVIFYRQRRASFKGISKGNSIELSAICCRPLTCALQRI